eukprot:5119868-Amphidinium_carterae.1
MMTRAAVQILRASAGSSQRRLPQSPHTNTWQGLEALRSTNRLKTQMKPIVLHTLCSGTPLISLKVCPFSCAHVNDEIDVCEPFQSRNRF